jgi:hypothetical protein
MTADPHAATFDELSAPPEGGADLRQLLRACGGRAYAAGALPAEARTDSKVTVDLLDTTGAPIDAEPLDAAGFLDGVQATRCLAWRGRRPITLTYCAAGAVRRRNDVVGLRERLCIVASTADHDWVRDLPGGLDVVWITESSPPEVGAVVHDTIAKLRAHLEDRLTDEIVASGASTSTSPLVVDGDLRSTSRNRHGDQVVAVAKTHQTRWLPDESELYHLPEGWRSARFHIPAGAGVHVDRYSCYVRLWGSGARPWNFGLIRLETLDPDQLDGLAATAMALRQGSSAPDSRWDRQLAPVRAVEEWLRVRRPIALRP